MSTAVARIQSYSVVRGGLLLFAAYHLGLAIWMAAAPHSFYDSLGPFGGQNDHYLRDTATFEAAFGVALAIAARRPAWRIPVLATVVVQFALHALNHLADIGEAHPHWIGPFDFASLAMATAALAWLLLQARKETPR